MRRAERARLLAGCRRELTDLAAALGGDPLLARELVERVLGRAWPSRGDADRVLLRLRRAVVRAGRRVRSPWTRDDPLGAAVAVDREVLALRVVCGLPLAAVAHLLDLPVGRAGARETSGLAATGCADLDDLREQVRVWLDDAPPDPGPPPRPRAAVQAVGLAGVAVLGVVAVLLVAAVPLRPPDDVREVHVRLPGVVLPARLPARTPAPAPTGTACPLGSDALCELDRPATGVLPSAEGVDPRSGTPFWPFTTEREATDWAVDAGSRSWALDPVQVAVRLARDLLRLPGVDGRLLGGGQVALERGGQPLGTVRLVRLGRGADRPWSVVGVTSAQVQLLGPRSVWPGAPSEGRAEGPVLVRLVTTSGTTLGRAPLGHPLPWRSSAWSVGALVALGPDGQGLALQPVRRVGAVDPGVPAPGSTFVSVADGRVQLQDALSGAVLLPLSSPPPATYDHDPSRGGRDGVVFVRDEPDSCTTTVLRAALDGGPTGVLVPRRRLARRLPRLSPAGHVLGWVEAPCGRGPATLALRGPDGRERRLALGGLAVDGLDVRDDGSAVLQAARPARVLLLPPGARSLSAALPALPAPRGCAYPAAAAVPDGATVLWRRCAGVLGAVAVLRRPDGAVRELGRSPRDVVSTSVVQAPDGPLVLARTDTGAVARLVAGRLVDVQGPCRDTSGCPSEADW